MSRPPPAMPDLDALAFLENPSGLRWSDVKPGSGAMAVAGSNASVHYTGWLEDGEMFDTSWDRGAPFQLEDLGNAPVIEGWNEGVVGMRVGGSRVLVIPPDLGYGAEGAADVIPPHATLVFRVDLVALEAI